MKQEENIRELAIQYFEGRISRADEKNLFEYIEQVEGGYGRFRAMGERMDESPEYRFGDMMPNGKL